MRAPAGITGWWLGLLGAIALASALRDPGPLRAIDPGLPAGAAGRFAPDGQFPEAVPPRLAAPVRFWGSWAGSDRHEGTLTLGPFNCPRRMRLLVAGYPARAGNGIFLERSDGGGRLRIDLPDAGEAWQPVTVNAPAGWRDRPVRLVAVDGEGGHGGWLGISEPLQGRAPGGEPARPHVLRAWLSQLLVLAVIALGGARWICSRRPAAARHGPSLAVAIFVLSGLPWALVQHLREPHFTTLLAGALGGAALTVLLAGMLVAVPVSLRERTRELGQALRRWHADPHLTPWVIGAVALLLFLRKPHALHTAQLWAEDGSIFLAFQDLLGARALIEPYMGYLHTIPRLVAWTAAGILDPAWWPTFYNGVAFVIWVAVIARMFSRRVPLPGKPWLALAFIAGPQTGEILFNITNVQWVSAFALVQHVLLTPPATRMQRTVDLVILAVVALTGPFAIAFLPLFAWQAWRERRRDTAAALLVVGTCAAIQVWFILTTAEKFEHQAQALQLWPTIEVLARRLLVWPVAGEMLARAIPRPGVAALGVLLAMGVLAAALHPGPHRGARRRIAAALVLITVVVTYRTRPDTWDGDNLAFGDRYFYIPRVLLFWLFVLHFHAQRRVTAACARVLYASMLLVHVPNFVVPTPPDYHWKEHCDPIRRGEPANIKTLPEGWWIEYRGRPRPQ